MNRDYAKKQFVPFELAKELKEMGFDEPCIGYYSHTEDSFRFLGSEFFNHNISNGFQSAPLWQQAFGWLLSEIRKTNKNGVFIEFAEDGSGSVRHYGKDDDIIIFDTLWDGLFKLIKYTKQLS